MTSLYRTLSIKQVKNLAGYIAENLKFYVFCMVHILFKKNLFISER